MKMTMEEAGPVCIVRVSESRLTYNVLGDFSSTIVNLVSSGTRNILIDLAPVTYIDSATIGCFMDLYRQVHGSSGQLKLTGVQKRVETMLTLTGAQNFIEICPDEPSAVKSFGV